MPITQGLVLHGHIDEATSHIVDQDVNGAMILQRTEAGGFAFSGISHVGLERESLAPQGPDFLCRGIEAGGIPSGENDLGSGLGDRQCHLPPEPTASSGDKESFAGEGKAVEEVHGWIAFIQSDRNAVCPSPKHAICRRHKSHGG